VDVLPPRKKDWVLTREAFDKLLSRLDPDRERSGEEYERLRGVLVNFFEWRGSLYPDEHADETLNRVARRLAEGEVVQDFHGYCYGVARRLWLEVAAEQGRGAALAAEPPEPPDLRPTADEQAARERRLGCFEHCLRALPRESREMLIRYYRAEKRARIDGRAALAAHYGITLNTLRVRTHRLRAQLEKCIAQCLK
jgi:DNA-directed RNA polymerase specialized sigma24 family protein